MTNFPDSFNYGRLKTRQLVLLAHLDERRSIFHAAKLSHMTQSAASKLLCELEETLGVELFVRHSRGVEPTWYGEILIRHAHSMLAELKHAFEEVTALKSGLSGQTAIGTVITSATNLVPHAVAELKKRFPQVLVNIEMDFSETLIRHLQEGKLDMVIARIHNPRDLAELHFEPLGEAPHAMVARTGHPLARKRKLSWNDLAAHTWIVPPQGNVMRDQLMLLFLEHGLQMPRQLVETASPHIIISLLEISDMIAPLPKEVVQPYCTSGILKQLAFHLDIHLGPAGIITRREHKLSPSASAMLSILREEAGRRAE